MSYNISQILAIIWSWMELVSFIGGGIYSYTKYEKSRDFVGSVITIFNEYVLNETVIFFDKKIHMWDFWMACIVVSAIGALSAFLLMFGILKKIRPMLIPWITTEFSFILIAICYIYYNGKVEYYLIPAFLAIVWIFIQYVSANLYHRERLQRQYNSKATC